MITNADMTLYSYSAGEDSPTYTRHEIRGVSWQDKKRAGMSDKGYITEDTAKVYIPFSSAEIAPKKMDIAVRGIATDLATAKDIFHAYPDAGTVTSVQRRDTGGGSMRHYEIEVAR